MSQLTEEQLEERFDNWLNKYQEPHPIWGPPWGNIENSDILKLHPNMYLMEYNDWLYTQTSEDRLFCCRECCEHFNDKTDMSDNGEICKDCLKTSNV
ncbi:MAG: hypothetical protein U9N86_03295 [Bacteroidota bacterium]|nr:hypothetical protein [Bacteroidota bacterium]